MGAKGSIISSSDGDWFARSVDGYNSPVSTHTLHSACQRRTHSQCPLPASVHQDASSTVICRKHTTGGYYPFLGCRIALHMHRRGPLGGVPIRPCNIRFSELGHELVSVYAGMQSCCLEITPRFPFAAATTNVLVSGATGRTSGSSLSSALAFIRFIDTGYRQEGTAITQ